MLLLQLLVPHFPLKALISVREGSLAVLTCPAWMSSGCSKPDMPAFPSFHTWQVQAAAPHLCFPRQLPGVGHGHRHGCPARSWHLSALFIPKPKLRSLGKGGSGPPWLKEGMGTRSTDPNPTRPNGREISYQPGRDHYWESMP